MNTPHTSQSLLLDHAESLQPLPSTTSVEEVERRAHVASVESIDFDFYESEQGLAVTATKQKRIVQAVAKWIAIAIIGVATGSVASGIDYGIVRLTEMRFGLMRTLVRHGLSSTLLVLANMAICTSLAGIAGALVCFVSPLAAGSGIPEVKCRLNGLDLPLVVKPQTLLAKACGVLFSVSAGLPCGKEGPMIHSGSIIGALLSKALQLYELLLFPDRDERDLIAAGGAAGVSSAFGAPVGGVLFALEEGASFWSPQVLLQALFCSSVSALTLNFFLGGFDSLGFGTLGALGVLTFGSYFQSDATSYRIWELPFFFGVGILGGLVGATFNALNVPLTIWRQWCVGAGGTRRFFEVMTVTAVISTAFVFLPAVMRQCVVPDVISDQHGDLKLICDASSESRQNSIESALGLFMTPSEDAIKVLFHDPAAFHPLYLALFAALYFFMACWTYGLGVPSGLFVPSLLTGAALGRLLGEGLQAVCSRGQGGPGLHVSSPGVYALVGAAASLGGMARITISLAVILVEATGNTQFSIPIIFAVLTSKAVGDCFNRGIYDIHIHLKKLPFLEAPTEVECHKQLVSSVMTQDVRTVFPVESVARLKDLLGRNSHGAFPVVDSSSSFRFQGMLSRSALQSALQAQVGLESFQGRVLQGSNDGMHCDQMIELKSWISPAAFSISNTATVRRSFDLFRTMGLRHLPVVDSTGTLCGIVTRKDLAEHCTHD